MSGAPVPADEGHQRSAAARYPYGPRAVARRHSGVLYRGARGPSCRSHRPDARALHEMSITLFQVGLNARTWTLIVRSTSSGERGASSRSVSTFTREISRSSSSKQ